MKALTCEMCGSTDIIKQDGLYVCQSCGTKYTVEEAKKMMVEGTVDVQGTVKIDTSSELQNLYEIARRAKNSDNSENAEKYYDQILVKDPNSWEANFYVVYFKAMSCKIAEIQSAAISVTNNIPSVLELVKEHVPSEEQSAVIAEIYTRLTYIASLLSNAARNHYEGIDLQIRANYIQEYVYMAHAASEIMYTFGDMLESLFEEKFGSIAAEAWKDGVKIHNSYLSFLDDKESSKNYMKKVAEKIIKYDSSYTLPEFKTSSGGGCYVATAVYGSYDCPEVWTLRRFRDFSLAETWYGRVFVRTYYAVSPTIVKWFGKTEWFKTIWRKRLDKLVGKLHEEGVEDTPYVDREW